MEVYDTDEALLVVTVSVIRAIPVPAKAIEAAPKVTATPAVPVIAPKVTVPSEVFPMGTCPLVAETTVISAVETMRIPNMLKRQGWTVHTITS